MRSDEVIKGGDCRMETSDIRFVLGLHSISCNSCGCCVHRVLRIASHASDRLTRSSAEARYAYNLLEDKADHDFYTIYWLRSFRQLEYVRSVIYLLCVENE